MIKKTLYLAVFFAAGPCFAASDSLQQLETLAGGPERAARADYQSSAVESVGAPGYAEAAEAFNAYRESKRGGIKNEDNLPFMLAHGARTRNTVIMIHGLTDSPWYMRKLGEILYRQGYNVISLLLPGHGTKPEDLTNATNEEWRQEVDRGLSMAAGFGERISMAGFSTGGALSLDALRRYPELKLRKLFLFSPALAINESNQEQVSLGCQAPWLTTMIKGPYNVPADTVEDSPYRYNKMAINGVCQLYGVIQDNKTERAQILDNLDAAGTAVFAVESDADATVSPAVVTDFMAALRENSGSVYIRYPLAEGIAHAAVTRPETNPHFAELSRKLREFAAED